MCIVLDKSSCLVVVSFIASQWGVKLLFRNIDPPSPSPTKSVKKNRNINILMWLKYVLNCAICKLYESD